MHRISLLLILVAAHIRLHSVHGARCTVHRMLLWLVVLLTLIIPSATSGEGIWATLFHVLGISSHTSSSFDTEKTKAASNPITAPNYSDKPNILGYLERKVRRDGDGSWPMCRPNQWQVRSINCLALPTLDMPNISSAPISICLQ